MPKTEKIFLIISIILAVAALMWLFSGCSALVTRESLRQIIAEEQQKENITAIRDELGIIRATMPRGGYSK